MNNLPSSNLTDVPLEWAKVHVAAKRFSISRSGLYELMSAGKIKTRCLRKAGNTRGLRLINVESLRSYIESQPI